MDGTTVTVLAGIAGALVTGFFTYATQGAAARAAVRNAELSSRTDLAKQVGEEARAYWSGVVADQNRRIAERDTELIDVRSEARSLRAEVETLRDELEDRDDKIAELEREVRTLSSEVRELTEYRDAAEQLLQLKFPDED